MKRPPIHPAVFLFAALLAFLPSCNVFSNHQRHGDFTTSNAAFLPSSKRWLSSPAVTTALTKPVELTAINLPAATDPLSLSFQEAPLRHYESPLGRRGRTVWRGTLLIEALSYPDRKPLGSFVHRPQNPSVRKFDLSAPRQPRKSFIVRVSAKEPFDPPWQFSFVDILDVSGSEKH